MRCRNVLMVFLAGWSGCAGNSSAPPAPETSIQQSREEAAEPVPAGQTESPDIPLAILDWEATQALIQAQRGKVVVVDLWATYCPPCIAEFPNLVQLSRQYPDRVACISVSADYDGLDDRPPESYRERVLKFLDKQQATFQNVLLSIDAETLFNEKIQHKSIPVVYVYDREGNLAGQFPDLENPAEFTYQEHVLPLVKKLLTSE